MDLKTKSNDNKKCENYDNPNCVIFAGNKKNRFSTSQIAKHPTIAKEFLSLCGQKDFHPLFKLLNPSIMQD